MHAFSCKTLRTTVIISCTIKNPSSSQLSIHYTCDKNEMVVNIPVFFFQFLIQTKKISMMCICSIRLPPLGIFCNFGNIEIRVFTVNNNWIDLIYYFNLIINKYTHFRIASSLAYSKSAI